MTTTSHIVRGAVQPERFITPRDNAMSPVSRGDGSVPKDGLWQAVMDWIVPWGYEDEAGFHYGRRVNQHRAN